MHMHRDSSERLEQTIHLAETLIKIPSANPPGNEDAIAAFVSAWLGENGVACRTVPLEEGRCSIVARIPGTADGCVVFCAHLDTVTAPDDAWRQSPFVPVLKEGRLWGLGASDMKSAVAALMQTFAEAARAKQPLEKDIVLMLTADEEWGYRGARSVAESGWIDDAELVIIAEPTENHVHAGQKGELWVEATFTGREAHGSMPDSGASAILPAARFCRGIKETVDGWSEVAGRGRTSLNIGRFNGGRQVNIVPGQARLELDFRVASSEHYEAAIQTVARIGTDESDAAGCTFASREMTYHPPIASSMEHPWAQRLIAAAQSVTGRKQPFGLTPYSTDAVAIVPVLDVPVLICGPGSILQAHQPNEFIEVEQIAQALEILRSMIAPSESLSPANSGG
jgi:succinyl-diaminopimelate desuccinylase